MQNNYLRLIGYALCNITEYNPTTRNPYPPYYFEMEVEFYGFKKGDFRQIKVWIPNANKLIDKQQDITGKMVIVEGYLNVKTKKDTGEVVYEATAREMYLVGSDENNSDLFAVPDATGEQTGEQIEEASDNE